ncbi:MAG: nuclease-related domain-containing protein [Bacillales bacterium]
MNNLDDLIKIIFSVISVILVLLVIFIIVYPFIKKKLSFKYFKRIFYHQIYKIALYKDYLLINELVLKNDEGKICSIDHILFGEKFIYVIKDRYYRGALSGEYKDNIWFFYNKKNVTKEIQNPMLLNEKRIEKLANVLHYDKGLFISIVIVNNDCTVKNLDNLNQNNSYIVKLNKLKKLIKKLEKTDIRPINQKELEEAVLMIHELKGKKINEDIEI